MTIAYDKCPKSEGDEDLHSFEAWLFQSCNPIYQSIWLYIVYNLITGLFVYYILVLCKRKLDKLVDPNINGNGVTIYSLFIFKFIQMEFVAYLLLLMTNSFLGLFSYLVDHFGAHMSYETIKVVQHFGVIILTIQK